ncbi:ribbon-helix-helix protein, CopG family [Miniimonas sp. S16]|uniref:ribbon-helix-helix protein, CopG family n=1 Tax=Miniimonas sp. S16 TaxID=2171623 RepID=UPI000D528F34|nr:ribbon-helix-helix protein, CopG family [Miniimonas sp. S16]
MTSTTIRVPQELRDRLAALAAHDGSSIAAVVERAIAAREREAFWDVVRSDALAGAFQLETFAGPSAKNGLEPESWEDVLRPARGGATPR